MVIAAVDASPGLSTSVLVVLAVALALIAALVLAEVIAALVRAVGRRSRAADALAHRARLPLRALLVVVLLWQGLRLALPGGVAGWGRHTLAVTTIVAAAWLIGALAFALEDVAVARYPARDSRHARRVRTQVGVVRRTVVLVLVVGTVAAVAFTFESGRTVGAGLLASAGLISVVVGVAAQTTLGNVVAGLQIAFTDAIRLDDVVVVDGQWGRIEEITMTYVVVHLWDDRRLILPSTHFTTTAFENWTRRAADLLGTVELDVDWTVPVGRMRAELMRLLQASELWDHRVGVLQVTEAVDGRVRVRALASAADAPTLWDLRCTVREGLVAWLQREHPEALPRTRWEQASPGPTGAWGDRPREATVPELPLPPASLDQTALVDGGRESGLFTGSFAAVQRSKAFTGPGQDVIAEREHHAAGLRVPDEEPGRRSAD